MKRFILICTFLIVTIQGSAQPNPVYSQYMYNQFVINPAYAGSRNSMSALLLHRTRWSGIQDAPSTSTVSIQSALLKSNFAWGFNMASDRLGPLTNLTGGLTGAYHLRMKKGRLAFGLRAGLYNRILNGDKLDYRDVTDPLFTGSRQSALIATFDFGMYYYTRKFYIGLAIDHLNGGTFEYTDFANLAGTTGNYELRSFTTLGTGYAFELNDNFVLKPSILLKGTVHYNINMDLNLSLLMYKKVWLGFSFRNNTSLNFLLDVNVTDYIRMGYSYDIFMNSINQASRGAHEFFIGFDFGSKDIKTVSPRYL